MDERLLLQICLFILSFLIAWNCYLFQAILRNHSEILKFRIDVYTKKEVDDIVKSAKEDINTRLSTIENRALNIEDRVLNIDQNLIKAIERIETWKLKTSA